MHPFQVMGEGFDSSFIAPSFRGALSVSLVVEEAIVIIVPLVAPLLFGVVSFLAPVFNPATSVSIGDGVAQVTVIPVSPSAVFLWWSQTIGRVPFLTLSVVRILTPRVTAAIGNRVHHGCCVQHHLEELNLGVNFFVVFRQVGCELINQHPQGQSVVGRCEVDLLSLVFDPIDFLTDRP
jgi:hypothetical protein